MKTDIHEPRSVTIIRHVSGYLLTEKVSEQQFSDNVKTIYHHRVSDPKNRAVKFHEGGDAYEDMKANAQLLFRMFKPSATSRLPVDLEEPVVLALPEERQRDLKAELAERYDLLAAPIPHNTEEDNIFSLAVLLKTTGATVESLAPIMEDGKIDQSDVPYAKKALLEINKTMAALVSWQAAITSVLPEDLKRID